MKQFKGPRQQRGFLQFVALAASAIAAKRSADKAAKQGKKALASQEKAEDRQATIAEAQDRRAEQLYQDYRTTFEPRQRQLVADAFDNNLTSADAAANRAVADVRKATGNAMMVRDRNARRLGVDPSSGAYAATDRDIDIANAGLEASERGFARREARDSNFSRQSSVLGMGQNLPATAGNLSASAGGIFGNINASAQRRVERADQLGAAAGQAFGQAVTGAAGLVAGWTGKTGGGGGTTPYADAAVLAGGG